MRLKPAHILDFLQYCVVFEMKKGNEARHRITVGLGFPYAHRPALQVLLVRDEGGVLTQMEGQLNLECHPRTVATVGRSARYAPPNFLSAPQDPFAVSTSASETSTYRQVTPTFASAVT